ncbi:phosphatidylserine decarboxylase [Microvirga sp. SRT01]|jgi:phosphatidylserine decarboxylase|uniref:Phosphatidylserine decarboxylase proenzyme n=1 Tax=Sphingomonas longa TaxID=2778730 RepID=A0ABS2D210_9SPHN|nr:MULTISPECIES: phosphatidylserine decarboxylase [Alphaproteobacteria]MBM6574937.1 phosphatidylserine decarboxylase [Sphingomonas sp. BT552]MBR7707988.1 phosphatidylserine decarboxylase [Microvirga sp. SRT01]
MTSLDKPPLVTSTVKWRFPAVHPEGRKYVAISTGITLLLTIVSNVLFWPLVGLTIWVAAFFRDPIRTTPQGEDLIVAPADGLVTMIQRVAIPRELVGELGEAPLVRVSIFMSVFDVHINRTPIAGTIRQVVYISGKFLNADLDKASDENERQHFVVEGRDGRKIGFTQIAGLVARRIVGFVKPGDMVAVGQRVGLIRFGSRVDVYLPDDCAPQVALGQRSIAGETVLGRVGGVAAFGIAQ